MTEYQVVLIGEDGEYILRQTNNLTSAVSYVEREKNNYGDGQSIAIREVNTGYFQ